ncbi:MAG: hypothetical protein ACI4EQ_04835 [Lachnospiraceae bacterium]
MERAKRKNLCKLNNKGSAIVTVIVVVAFITILATTILYVSGMNYYMKMTDLRTKESFYEAETALEEIKAALAVEVAKASDAAYEEIMINYAATDGYTRYSLYESKFYQILKDNWEQKRLDLSVDGNPVPYLEVLQSYVETPYKAGLTLDASNPTAGSIDLSYTADGYAIVKGVQLTYSKDGYTTMITTDYVITVPELNWGIDSAKADWTVGDGAEALDRNKVDMAEYVSYCNWVKK